MTLYLKWENTTRACMSDLYLFVTSQNQEIFETLCYLVIIYVIRKTGLTCLLPSKTARLSYLFYIFVTQKNQEIFETVSYLS